jgi:VIT1/CCC1 family predicted Fe2+/Mn2+ transporter
MSDTPQRPVQFTEDRIPREGIEDTVSDLIDLYGGELIASQENERRFELPLRRGIAAAGGVECTVSWAAGEAGDTVVTLVCNRDVDAPKAQRIALLVAGVIGSLLFMVWPFFAHSRELGALAWIGGIIALAVYFMTLRKTSGGIAYDFLQRLAKTQRSRAEAVEP